MPGLDQVTVFDPGWLNARTMVVADVAASWGINDVGRLACTVRADEAEIAGGLTWTTITGTILGRWITWEHPLCGVWAGYVEDAVASLETGTVDLGCVGLVNLLQYRRTALGYGPQQMSPGGLVLRATQDSADDDAIWLAEVKADESPAMVRYEWTGESVMELMNSLVSETGEEWLATSDAAGRQTLQWRVRCGTNKVVHGFHEGVQVLGGRVERSIANLVNDIQAVADDDAYTLSSRTRVVDRGSILTFGRRQQTRRYLGVVTESTLEPVARRELARSVLPVEVITIEVAQNDMRLADVREGSRVFVTSPTVNRQYRARVLARSVEVGPGIATLACEVEKAIGVAPVLRAAGILTTAGL